MSRRPLSNTDAEEALLGCCLVGGQETVNWVREKSADPLGLFVSDRCMVVWAILAALADANQPIGPETVYLEIKKGRDIGPDFLPWVASLPSLCASALQVEYFWTQLDDLHRRRKLWEAAQRIQRSIEASTDTTDQIIIEAEAVFSAKQSRGLTVLTAGEAVRMAAGRLEERLVNRGKIGGLSTGFADLDYWVDGLQPGELVIVGARPSQGKTAIGMNIAAHVALDLHKPVAIFTLEMSARALVDRIVCGRKRINSLRYRRADLDDSHYTNVSEAYAELSGAPMFFIEGGNQSASSIVSVARRLHRTHSLSLIVIDYLQKIAAPTKNEKRTYEIEDVSRAIQWLARELQIPVVALAQLNREVEKDKVTRKPRLADLADSKSIEQDADVAILLHRHPGQENADVVNYDLIIAKNRDGVTREIPVVFFPAYTTFANAAKIEPVDIPKAAPSPAAALPNVTFRAPEDFGF